MEFAFGKNSIEFNRELSYLDRLVIGFTEILKKQEADYVIVSGYIAILFGRSRETEDVDIFIEDRGFEKFAKLWGELERNGFECINAASAAEAFHEYLNSQVAIRFAVKGTFIPNFELKFPKTKYNRYSLKRKVRVLLNGNSINISELELQVAFKLKLGSKKDFEDARHLYKLFKEHLNKGLLLSHISELRVEREAEKILWKN